MNIEISLFELVQTENFILNKNFDVFVPNLLKNCISVSKHNNLNIKMKLSIL